MVAESNEETRLSKLAGIKGVYKNMTFHIETTHSLGFLGLHEEFGA